MKKIFITSLSTLLIFIGFTYNACKPDKCKQVSCAYSATCKEGICLCQVGYEGEQCETVTRDKFKGIWNIDEDGTLSSVAQYTVSMENGSKINEILIKNFQNNFEEDVTAIAYLDTLTIPVQTFANGKTIEGWGYIIDTNPLNQHYYQHAILTMYYKVTDSLGITNEYGSSGSQPSVWSK